MANDPGGSTSSNGNPYPQYIGPAGSGIENPMWRQWNFDHQFAQPPTQTYPTNGPQPAPHVSTALPNQQYTNDASQYAAPTSADMYHPAVAGQAQDKNTGIWWNYDQYGNKISQYVPPSSGTPSLLGGAGGPTWYEQQQIALDKQRIADAEAAQAAQLAYQHQQQLIAESNAVEAANQSFRDAQLKSTYGTINGMAYGAPKGSPFVQLLPEPSLIKQGYVDAGQPDPWSQAAPYGGYTGSSYMNAQQPGLSNAGDPNMAVPTSGPGSAIPSAVPTTPPTRDQLDSWHAIAHQIAPGPTTNPGVHAGFLPPTTGGIPSMASGGTVPGNPGQPQLIMAHGGETIIPADNKPQPTMATPMDVAAQMVNRAGIPGYSMGGVVPNYSSAQSPFDYSQFLIWHDAMHNSSTPQPSGFPQPFNTRPLGSPVPVPTTNTYGQAIGSGVTHGPQNNDITPGPGSLNHLPYSPALTGLSGFGATITPNGTPVVMSNWQRQHLMPSSISGPGGYDDYAMQVAGWSPQDLQQLGQDITGGFGKDLSAPVNYTPIAAQPAPAGG